MERVRALEKLAEMYWRQVCLLLLPWRLTERLPRASYPSLSHCSNAHLQFTKSSPVRDTQPQCGW